jgi:hypothetical protein
MISIHRAGSSVLFSLVRCASLLVPKQQRADWLAEWKGELAYVLRTHARGSWFAWNAPAGFCFGALSDALWIAKHNQRLVTLGNSVLRTPLRCMSCLVILAALGWLSSSLSVNLHGIAHPEMYQEAAPSTGSFLLEILIALIILPSTTSLSMGEYPAYRVYGRRKIRWQPQVFLLSKVMLVFLIAYCAGMGLNHLMESLAVHERWSLVASAIRDCLPPVQPVGSCLVCLYGMRWTLRDQRQRCPSCLHLLSSPARVGTPSRSFLSWNGTELICRGGHGLLHVPEMQMSWLATQSWQDLDASWQPLFRE